MNARRAPTFFDGVVVAAIGSVAAGAGWFLLSSALPAHDAIRVLVAALGCGYLLYLLQRAPGRVGRVSLVALWGAGTAALVVFDPPLAWHVAAQLGVAWFARTLFHHGRMLPALADLGLTLLAAGAGAWTLAQTHSVFGATWTLLLVQALYPCIPGSRRGTRREPSTTNDPFERAFRNAETAFERALRD